MRHSQCGITTYGLTAYRKGDEHPAYTPVGVWHTLPFLLPSRPFEHRSWLCSSEKFFKKPRCDATETGKEPEQLLLTTYELADMSAVFNIPEMVLFSVLRDVLSGEDWIDQPQVVSTLQAPLLRLCARYLYVEKKRGYALNPVGKPTLISPSGAYYVSAPP